MPVETPETIKGELWNLDAVEIRKVLRWLNNNVRKSVNPTELASAKHEWCLRRILNNYQLDSVEDALNWLKAAPKSDDYVAPPSTPPIEIKFEKPPPRPEVNDIKYPDDAPVDPITKALLPSIERAVNKRVAEFEEHLSKEFGVIAEERTQLLAKFDAIKRDVGSITLEFGDKLGKRLAEIEEQLKKSNAVNLTVTFPDIGEVQLGLVHRQQALLIKYLSAGCHVFLTGPAGSGKSTAGEKAAQALGLRFGATSCCSQDTVTKFMGYMDAAGTYHTTEFRVAYAEGGVFVIDEMDAGNPNVLAVLNSALSNSQCAFPDGMVKRHDNFRCVATGNTWGSGKTIQYVGRNAIDAATLNRFVVIYWDYDEALETKIAGMPAWSSYVQAVRAEVKKRGINFLITPRASIYGARALASGVPLKDVMDCVLFPNFDPELRRQFPKPPPQLTEIAK